jgi:hypothetical protein
MTRIDRARIYINHVHKSGKVKNSDIEIKGIFLSNGKWYDSIISPTDKFIPFPYTDKVHNYYLTLRLLKLLKLKNL